MILENLVRCDSDNKPEWPLRHSESIRAYCGEHSLGLTDRFSQRHISNWAISSERNWMMTSGNMKLEPQLLETLEHFRVQERFIVNLYVWGCGFDFPCVWQCETTLRAWHGLFYKENLEWMWCLCPVVQLWEQSKSSQGNSNVVATLHKIKGNKS